MAKKSKTPAAAPLHPRLTNVPATPGAAAAALAVHTADVGNPCADCADGAPCMTTVDPVTGETVTWTCQGGHCLP